MEDSYVKIMKCRFCGHETNALALDRRLKPIKDDVYDTEPCDKCKELFRTHKYFVGMECRHCGFIRTTVLKKIMSPEAFKRLDSHRIFKVDKCFACLGVFRMEDCTKM